MEVKQIAVLVNNITSEILGTTLLLKEDLSNLVDVGNAVFNADKVDNYVKSLVNHIGRVVFVDRAYSGSVPSVLMDSWNLVVYLKRLVVICPLQIQTGHGIWKTDNRTTQTFSINRPFRLNSTILKSLLRFPCHLLKCKLKKVSVMRNNSMVF